MNGNPNQDSQTRDCTLTGALIDEQGREVPITADMIQQACDELKDTCIGGDTPTH